MDKENSQFILYVDGNPVIQTTGISGSIENGVYSLKKPVSEEDGKNWCLPFGSGQCIYGAEMDISDETSDLDTAEETDSVEDLQIDDLEELLSDPAPVPEEDGCFAIPEDSARDAFSQCKKGMPVIIYSKEIFMKTRKKGFFNPLKVKELRRKMLLIIGVMFIIRLLNQIPTPGVNHDYLKQILGGSGAMGFMDLMTGGSLSSLSILALNISPYITASIVIELLSIVFKQLDEMKRDGKHGQEELKKITLYSAIGLSFIQALAMSVGFGRKGMLTHFTWYWVLIITLIWTASAGALAFVGNYMTEKKLCNGVSLILACNILSGVLDDLFSLWETAFTGHKTAQGTLYISLLVVFIFLMTFFVVYLQTGKREIPVTNARKFNGRVNPAAMKSTLPIPVNPSNVIPVIFASCIFSVPSMIAMVVTPKSGSVWAHIVNLTNTSDWFRPSEFYYTAGWIVYVALILFFEVFYNNIIFNVLEISDNMKKAGSQIPGIRPGADTAEYLRKKVKHTTLLGGIGISIVATVPMVLSGVFHISNISLMGTSLVIIVGVIIENARQIDADTSAYKFEGIIR